MKNHSASTASWFSCSGSLTVNRQETRLPAHKPEMVKLKLLFLAETRVWMHRMGIFCVRRNKNSNPPLTSRGLLFASRVKIQFGKIKVIICYYPICSLCCCQMSVLLCFVRHALVV